MLHKKIKLYTEDEILFHYSRLLILFDVLDEYGVSDGIGIERVSYYDMFSDKPFLIFQDDEEAKIELLFHGFESKTLGYISSSQIFSSRREKLRHYIAGLICRNLISFKNIDRQIKYSITQEGKSVANCYKSLYVKAYKKSAELVIKKLSKISDTKLLQLSKDWLKAEPFTMDL